MISVGDIPYTCPGNDKVAISSSVKRTVSPVFVQVGAVPGYTSNFND